MVEILSIGTWRTNAELIADVAKLPGYLTAERPGTEWTVLDATYGQHGGFWKDWKPTRLVTNDLRYPADHQWDFQAMPVPDCWVDVVVLDADYKLNGTPALPEQDSRYGVDENLSRGERMDKIRAGTVECFRVCGRRLFVKCMDQVEGNQMRWQTDMVTRAVEELGGIKLARFDIGTAGRGQPTDRKCSNDCDHGTDRATLTTCNTCEGTGRLPIVQRNPRMKHSQLLAFAKPAKLRSGGYDGQATLL